ncbi:MULTISPECIES: Sir2 family NAD+-dependent deacetylase [unclassified Neptuniibacter]|uniref:Sir2 family NAD+-dependent deacetylase n=1 Tax=unclassified Neptuniibacter TaxID=2630693 RepID=UPI000C6434F0|nr:MULTISPECIES: Sir2 family NAD+-dependent deacetylase [unclassified Neptuniibacter]MAY43274.1 NAD-dependent protein deacylase [Oceanospirillaceae bacterium]|tara:strand:- start:3200 stop:3913 length:714 start_codon:yes stop_codon:yes gene_type:complete
MAIKSIVILTGAGISAESGIRTFRASDGLWEDHKVEDVATPEAFERNPHLVHRFYNERRKQLLSDEIKPNAAHIALAELEDKFPGDVLIVTQNIDNLHERAGSRNVLHMHGELLNQRCQDSGVVYRIEGDSQPEDLCQCCGSSGNLRPDIVWFGEMPMDMPKIHDALENCDLFVSIGTSGNVYPAAGFVEHANAVGALTVELNLEPSRVGSVFGHKVYGPASEVIPEFVHDILKQVP